MTSMSEELPLLLPVTSDTPSISHEFVDSDHLGTNNSSQQPTLTLSPLPANHETPVDGSHETRLLDERSLVRSPKKPKRSPTAEKIEGPCGSSEDSACNRELVQASDQSLSFDVNESSGFKLEKKDFDLGRNDEVCGLERENVSNFEKLDASCENCSEKQYVAFELEKNVGNFELKSSVVGEILEFDYKTGSCEHGSENQSVANEVTEFESGKSSNGDSINSSKIIDRRSETRDRNRDSNLNGGSAGASHRDGRKFVYSRKEMEALRSVNVKGQKKFWQKIRNGLEETVKKEYEELGSFKKHQKHVKRHQDPETRNCNAQGIVGESSLENVRYDAEILCPMELTCDASNNENVSNDWVEECGEEDESNDEYESIQRPAFYVEGEPDFESGPPEDGLEYLRRVRWEAAHIPKVKVARIDNSKIKKEQSVYMPKIPDIEKCPPHLALSKQWEDEFIADFSKLRLALSRVEDTSNITLSDPQSIILSPSEHKSHPSKGQALVELPKGGPTLSTVLDMEPATRVAVLKRRISLFENANNFSKDDCAWLFALCAAVDTPLDADTCASLRCLLRRCAKLRSEKSELDDDVVMLNVLATISGKFFKQSEN